VTTAEAAKSLGVSVQWFLKLAKSRGVVSESVRQTGKRGRPEREWTEAQVKAAGAPRK
jgi:hypothetical protein